MGPERYLEERSYFEWGLKELDKRIQKHKGGDVSYLVVMPFIDEMKELCCIAKTESQRFAFSVAADAGEYVLDQIMLRGERK